MHFKTKTKNPQDLKILLLLYTRYFGFNTVAQQAGLIKNILFVLCIIQPCYVKSFDCPRVNFATQSGLISDMNSALGVSLHRHRFHLQANLLQYNLWRGFLLEFVFYNVLGGIMECLRSNFTTLTCSTTYSQYQSVGNTLIPLLFVFFTQEMNSITIL